MQQGTGKTFVIRTMQSLLKVRNHTVISVATSAIASYLLEECRTVYLVFKIPIPCFADSVCIISMESNTANELYQAYLIIWDEFVMFVHYCIEAINRTTRVIKIILMFRLEESAFYSVGTFAKFLRWFLEVLEA